jgi:UPF0716 protein FxsA
MAGVVVLLLLALPFVELAVFIAIVHWVGFLPALSAVIVVSAAGAWLVRHQGLSVWRQVDARLRSGDVPSTEVVNGLLVLVAGVLLVVPGFVTDVLALALLVPPVRAVVRSVLFRRFEHRVASTFAGTVGAVLGAGPAPRVDAGRATYGPVRDVHEVDDGPPGAPGRPGLERP